MHPLEFLKTEFPDLEVCLFQADEQMWATMRHPDFAEMMKVNYYADDEWSPYCFQFATQHCHIGDKSDLLEMIGQYVSGQRAAIEFFADGVACFGGDLEASFLDEMTYDSLREYFGWFHFDIQDMSFQVRAWKKEYCFNACFEQDAGGNMQIVKRFVTDMPDVIALFEFNGTRKYDVWDGYRPTHLVKDDYLTTGVHHYEGVFKVPPDGSARGTITFLMSDAYPHCLWEGKKIPIQEGERVVGTATILQVLNPVLLAEDEDA